VPLPIPLTYGIIITCLVPAGGVRGSDPTSFWKNQERAEFCRALLDRTGEAPSPRGSRLIKKGNSSVLMIRLSRVGARKQPHYRVVVIEKERPRNGRPVEIVGTYNPRTTPASVELKRDRIDYWRSKGAQVSERVGKILSFAGKAPAEPVAS
jgi:small subunit ribosomal protein S16